MCGTIRVMYPFMLLNHVREKDLNFNTQYVSAYITEPNFYKDFTFVQFQRSATDQHINLYKHFKNEVQSKFKTPIVYEIDDLLIDIPEWNYASPYYKKMESNVKWLMENSDAMITSTPRLAEIYKQFNKKIEVIPNHLPKFVWQDIFPAHEYKREGEKIKILWAGSQNHFAMPEIIGNEIKGGDFGDELIKYIRMTTDLFEWHLMGAMPVELRGVKDKIHFHAWENIFNYPRTLKAIEPDICIAPLIDNVFNSCKCLVGNTKVVTDSGIKNIKDVKINDKIWQECDYKNLSNNIKYEKKKTFKIITKFGYEIEGTENHKIRSNNNFKMLKDFKLGDFCDLGFFEYPNVDYQELSAPLFLTKKLDSIDSSSLDENLLPKIKINEEWGRFLGYILGDGHLCNSNSVGISQDKRYEDVIDNILNFVTKIGINSFKVKKNNSEFGVDLIFSSRNLKWFLGEKIGFNGRYGKILKVPDVIWKSPKSVVREFIRGLFESDGTVSKCSCSFVSKELQLVKDIQFLLLGFGIKSRWFSRLNKKYNRYYHTLILQRQSCDIFYEKINFISKIKKQKLKHIIQKEHSNAFKEWNLNDEIIKIEESINDVYDIEVPENNFYLANGIISHNSNIKSLEYTAIGAASIFSDVIPYKSMTLRCKTDVEFIHYIEKLAVDIDLRASTWKKDFSRVESQLYWEENNNLKKFVNTYLSMFGQKL